MTGPTVVVTGGSGFLGQYVLREFRNPGEERYRVVLLTDAPPSGWEWVPAKRTKQRYEFTPSDFTDRGITDIAALLHLGAATPDTPAEADDIHTSLANVASTGQLLERLPTSPRHIVFGSSVDVYAPSDKPLSETSVIGPSSVYGHAKYFAESLIRSWTAAHGATSMILRIGHLYGAGEEKYRKLIPETIRRLRRGERPVIFTHGHERRALLHASDCARSVVRAVGSVGQSDTVNVASATAHRVRDIVTELCKVHYEETGHFIEPDIHGADVPVRDVVFDATRAVRLFGPEMISLTDGLHAEYRDQTERAV